MSTPLSEQSSFLILQAAVDEAIAEVESTGKISKETEAGLFLAVSIDPTANGMCTLISEIFCTHQLKHSLELLSIGLSSASLVYSFDELETNYNAIKKLLVKAAQPPVMANLSQLDDLKSFFDLNDNEVEQLQKFDRALQEKYRVRDSHN